MLEISNSTIIGAVLHTAQTLNPVDHTSWSWQHYLLFGFAVIFGEWLQEFLVPLVGWLSGLDRVEIAIPAGGKMNTRFELIDYVYITLNRLYTPVFVYHVSQFVWLSQTTVKSLSLESFTFLNTLVGFIALWIVYDLPYSLFHMAMHHKSVYAYVHKHHHRQVVPWRGTLDGFNIHPLEMLGGSYCYLLSMVVVAKGIHMVTGGADGLHALTCVLYMAISAVFSGLNHTRYDIRIPGIYQTAYHDLHHYAFTYNYGQYLMMYDKLYGTFKPHPLEGKGLGVEKLHMSSDGSKKVQ